MAAKKKKKAQINPLHIEFPGARKNKSSYQQGEHVQWTKVTDENIDKKSECL